MTGRVSAVKQVRLGTELATAASATDDTLDVVDPDELDHDGGELKIGTEVHTYSIVDDVVTLEDALAGSFPVEEPVYIYPSSYERLAWLLGPGQEIEVEARVPHSLYDKLPRGIREPDTSAEEVEAELIDGELVVTDVLGRSPASDIGYLDGLEMNAGYVDIDTAVEEAVVSDPVSHGLSDRPSALVATVQHGVGKGTSKINATIGEFDDGDRTFTIKIRTIDGSTLNTPPGTSFVRVHWIALRSRLIAGQPEETGGYIDDALSTGTTD